VFPTTNEIENIFSGGGISPRYSGTGGTTDRTYTGYTTVPKGGRGSEKSFDEDDDAASGFVNDGGEDQ
jgi:hypothetical protein